MKYHDKRKKLTVGGYSRHRRQMELVLEEYFEISWKDTEVKRTQKNKIRFVATCSRDRWTSALDNLELNDFTLEQKTNLGRIMR